MNFNFSDGFSKKPFFYNNNLTYTKIKKRSKSSRSNRLTRKQFKLISMNLTKYIFERSTLYLLEFWSVVYSNARCMPALWTEVNLPIGFLCWIYSQILKYSLCAWIGIYVKLCEWQIWRIMMTIQLKPINFGV